MTTRRLGRATSYLITIAAVAASSVARWWVDPLLGEHLPFVTFFAAIAIASWSGGFRAGLLATLTGLALAWYVFVPPRFAFELKSTADTVGLVMFAFVGVVVAGFGEAMHIAQHRLAEQAERLRTTLASIGDGVITTDTEGRVTSLNHVASALTGWSSPDAVGQKLEAVFQIVNAQTRAPVEHPVTEAIRDGAIVGLANHTMLIARGGHERPIDDSAAPIRDGEGHIVGCVLVFRDVSERYRAEQELRRAKDRYHRILDTLPVGVYTSEAPSGTITYFNAQAEALWGQAPAPGDTDERFFGSRRDFVPEDGYVPRVRTPMAGALTDDQPDRAAQDIVARPDGRASRSPRTSNPFETTSAR